MKKIVSIFVAFLYLAVSSGLALEIHHCMGEIRDFSFTTSNSNTCESCGMPKGSKNCCKNELKFVKLQDFYKTSSLNYELAVPAATVHNDHHLFNTSFVVPLSISGARSHAPPGSLPAPLFIMNCVFRI